MPVTDVPRAPTVRRRALAGGLLCKVSSRRRDLLLGHLLRLGPADRRNRFCGHVSDRHISNYCHLEDLHRRIVIGYRVDGMLRGAGELVIFDRPGAFGAAEIALSVQQPWQNAGVGTEILRRLLVVARNRAVKVATMITLGDNRRVIAIARKFGGELSAGRGEVQLRFTPRNADVISLIEESWSDGFAVWRTLLGSGRTFAPDREAQSAESTCSTSVTQ